MRVVRELLRGRPAFVIVVGSSERVIRDLPVVAGILVPNNIVVFICHRVVVVSTFPRVVIVIADDVHGAIVIIVGVVGMVGMVGIVDIIGMVGMVVIVGVEGMVGMVGIMRMMRMVRVVLVVRHRRNAVHICHFMQTLCGLHLQQEAADIDQRVQHREAKPFDLHNRRYKHQHHAHHVLRHHEGSVHVVHHIVRLLVTLSTWTNQKYVRGSSS